MSDPFMGEIKLISWNYAPKNWAFCNGQFLPINQNQALFALFGTTYGGDGRVNFALPNLRGQVPIHMGNGHTLGEKGGATAVTISTQTMPTHAHQMVASSTTITPTAANSTPAATKYLAPGVAALQGGQSAPVSMYGAPNNLVALNPAAIANNGGSQPHNNMMPYLVLNFIVALVGIFPSQN